MDPTAQAFLTSWNWRPEVILIVAILATAYTTGWWRLRKQGARVARKAQLALYLAGLAMICLALLSPIDTFGSLLFFMHMIQHKLLTMLAPPLLLLADPLPVILWGLPRRARREVGRLLTRHAPVRRGLRALTLMPVAWLLFVVNLWVWHLPAAYEATLRNDLIHDLEHFTFFLTALFFWWPITNPAPRVHGHIPYGFRIIYVVAAAFQTVALGFLIAVTNRVLYPYYAATPRLWGLGPLYDQALGGGVMSEGGMIHGVTVLVLVARMLDHEERVMRQREARPFTRRSAAH